MGYNGVNLLVDHLDSKVWEVDDEAELHLLHALDHQGVGLGPAHIRPAQHGVGVAQLAVFKQTTCSDDP